MLLYPWNFPGKNTGIPISKDLSDPEIEPSSLAFPALAGRFFTTVATWEAQVFTLSKSPSLFSSSYSICHLCGVVKWIIRKICEAFLNVVLVKAFSRHLLIFSCFVLIPICFQNKVNAKHSYRIYVYKIYKYTIY